MPDQLPPQEYHLYDPERREIRVVLIQPPKRRYWLHALLFLATIFTTLCMGASMQYGFDHNLGLFSQDQDLWPWPWIFQDWHRLRLGITYSACLLAILTAHEFGHYVFCVLRRVFATLPFFIPAPTLIGTFGAFIRIKSPIRSRADLFDIGVGGPIAGFIVAVPVLIFGLLASKPLAGEAAVNAAKPDSLVLGLPLMFHLVHWVMAAMGSHSVAAQAPVNQLYLHPAAVAAWIGLLATSLNLLPGGQLDGGHIVFAVDPKMHRRASWLSIVILLLLSWYCWATWLLWALVLRFTGRHPDVPLQPQLDGKRRLLAFFALIMLALTFTPAPFVGDDASLRGALTKWKASRQHTQPQNAPSK
jgi:membrane-associated protease RseP (regulator of RpoE activity)